MHLGEHSNPAQKHINLELKDMLPSHTPLHNNSNVLSLFTGTGPGIYA